MFVQPSHGHEIWNGKEVDTFWNEYVSDGIVMNLHRELLLLGEKVANPQPDISAMASCMHVAYRPGFVLHHAIVGYRGCDDSVFDQSPLRMAPDFVVDFSNGIIGPEDETRREILAQAGVKVYWRISIYEDQIEVFDSFLDTLELVLKLDVHCRAMIPPFLGDTVAVKTLLYPKHSRRHIQPSRSR